MFLVLIFGVIVYYLVIYFLLTKTLRIFKVSSRFPFILYLLILSLPVFCVIDYYYRGIIMVEGLAVVGYFIAGFLIYYILLTGLVVVFKKIYNIIYDDFLLYTKEGIVFSSLVSFIVCVCGVACAHLPKVITNEIDIKDLDLKIVAVSDLHYESTGSMLSLKRMVKQINEEKPDIIFLVGDVFDDKIERINKSKFAHFMSLIDCKFGIYAVTGNHEFFQNSLEDIKNFYQDTNVKLLLDREMVIGNQINVVGRIDFSQERKAIKEIVKNKDFPLIVLDHQPQMYKEAIENNAIIQISGHTHNGQIFPGNLLLKVYNRLLFDSPIDGLHKFDNTHLMITKGYGTWGFPMRTTGRSEIIVFKL